MVRTRAKKSHAKEYFTIVLDTEIEIMWKNVKEKFKIEQDDHFLVFLLELAKSKYAWCR